MRSHSLYHLQWNNREVLLEQAEDLPLLGAAQSKTVSSGQLRRLICNLCCNN